MPHVYPFFRESSRFVEEMPNARLVWVEECGHVPHLEQPDKTAKSIVDFVQNGNPAKVYSASRSRLKCMQENA